MSRKLLAALAMAALVVACEAPEPQSSGGGTVTPAGDPAGCDGDGDCPAGQECLASAHACSAVGALPYHLSLNVVPPSTDAAGAPTSWIPTQWIDLAPGEEHEHNLTLATPVVLEGPVDLAGWNDACYVPTSVVATTAADIAGWVDYRFVGSVQLDPAGDGWRYRVAVLPDRLYRVTVFIGVGPGCPAAEAAYSPVVVERFVSDLAERPDLALVAPPLAEPLAGTLGFDDGTPVQGVRLVASSPDGSTTFGATVTDADGRFSLRLPQGMEQFVLTARATADYPQFPEQALEGAFTAGDAAKGDFTLTLPAPPPLATVRVLTRGPDGAPLGGVEVALTGEVAGGKVSMTVITDANGAALPSLYPGGYTLVASPDKASAAGALAASVIVGADDLIVDLASRVPTRIEVRDEATGDGVSSANLFLSLSTLAGSAAAVDRSYDLVTDAQGGADAWLEPGSWRLVAIPESASGLPRRALSDQVVGPQGGVLTVTIPAPWVLHGRVVDSAGQGVPNAVLEALSLDATDSLVAGAARSGYNDLGLTAVVGETQTDADGHFVLALPFAR